MRPFLLALVSVLLIVVVVPAARAERRALVIGNDAYTKIEGLRNAGADARAMAKALDISGFRVSPPVLNADRAGLFDAISRFAESIGPGDEAVVFYAGHAVELNGVNYLLPVDIRGDNERSVQYDAIPLQFLLRSVADQRPKFSLMVIDACRDNPFKGSGRNVGSRGLVPAGAAAAGQVVVYSASEGQKALDRLGPDDKSPNSVFTRVFVKEIEKGGAPVHELLRKVKTEVKRLAESVRHDQLPAIYDASEGEFYFGVRGTTAKAPPPSAGSVSDGDEAAFAAATAEHSVEAYGIYLAEFPKGRFAAAARIRMEGLKRSQLSAARPAQDDYKPGREFADCPDCPRMVVIPGGSFVMGSPASEEGRAEDEGPQRTVSVTRFALGKTEVSRGDFRRFVQDTGRRVSGCRFWDGKEWKEDTARGWEKPGFDQTDSHPAVCVSWEDASEYVRWLSARTGKTYRLASEAEWEYAARAGSTGSRHWGSADERACDYANVADQEGQRKYNLRPPVFDCDDHASTTAPVGSYRPNDFGVKDMLGNVWEWVEDCLHKNYQGGPADAAAWTTGNCALRITRGGAALNSPVSVRAGVRNWLQTSARDDDLGFRVARSLP